MKDYQRNISVESEADMSGDECNETFEDLLYLAEKEERLIKGVFESARVLEMCPEIVELCILPSGNNQDLASGIQHKLIQAYCWENDITVMELTKVDFNDMIKTQRRKSVDYGAGDCVLITSKKLNEDEIDTDDIVDDFNENFG